MKKIAAKITDTHLGDKNTELVYNIFEQLVEKMVGEKINTLFHLGDWFTSRKGQSLEVLTTSFKILRLLQSNDINLFIIPGNHDKVDLDSIISFLDVFSFCDRVSVIRVCDIVRIDGVSVTMLPYFKEDEEYPKQLSGVLKKISPKETNVLMTHIAVTGVKNNDGSEVTNNLSKNSFKAFKKVYVGHYHNRSKFGNIEYIGSAYQANFGEDNEKGFSWLLEDGGSEFVKLDFPEFVKLNISVDEMNTDQAFSELLGIVADNKGGNTRITIVGDQSKLKSFNKGKLTDIGVEVCYSEVEITAQAELPEIKTFDKSTILSTFENYCEVNNVDKKNSNYIKEKIVKCII